MTNEIILITNQPLISVIIPVHNGGKHIEKCLDALIASSYSPIEIIVVDDGSTDDTGLLSRQKGATVFDSPNSQVRLLPEILGLNMQKEKYFSLLTQM